MRAKEAGVNPALVGGVAGGLAGLGLGAATATGHGPDLEQLRAKVEQTRQDMQRPGAGGFAQALELAWQRLRLTENEAVQAHPVLGTLASGAAGAVIGAGLGQELPGLVREAVDLHKNRPRFK